MEIAQPGDIAHGIFVWLLDGDRQIPALRGCVPLPPEKTAAVIADDWLAESEALAIWCYCHIIFSHVDDIPEERLLVLRSALQIPDSFSPHINMPLDRESNSLQGLVEKPSAEIVAAINAVIMEWLGEHPAKLKTLDGLSSAVVEHPWDRRTLATLKAVPGIEKITSAIMDFYVRRDTVKLMASALEVTPQSLPSLYRLYMQTVEILGLKKAPPLYVDQMGGVLNAYTTGADNPIVVVSSLLVTCFSNDELASVLGHELGHIMAGHVRYKTLANYIVHYGDRLGRVIPVLGQLGFAGIKATMGAPLAAWGRCSEYTADRIGLLACQNEEAYWRAELKLMGYPWSHYGGMNGRILINQALRYENALRESLLDRMFEFDESLDLSHPRPVLRALELYKWVREGHMAEITDATPDGRRAMAEHVSRDPQHHAFITALNKEIIDWAVGEFDINRRECAPIIRRMMAQSISPAGTALASIMHVELIIQKKESELLYTVHVLLNRDGQPVRVSIDLPWDAKWEDAPDELRADFIRNNRDTIARVLYTITERR